MKLFVRDSHETRTEQCQIHLPYGLIGLPEMRQFNVAPVSGSWPLLSMKPPANDGLNFLVVEPHTLVAGYELEISNDDAHLLRLNSAQDALIYNIVTIHSLEPQFVTVNLVGPVVVNQNTLIGKQLIIANFTQYSTHHPLIDRRQTSDPP